MAFDGKIMNLDSGAESLFDVRAETVIAGNQKLQSYLPHITIPDIDQNDITEKVNPQLKAVSSPSPYAYARVSEEMEEAIHKI